MHLTGVVLIHLPPPLDLSQQKRKDLVSVLADVLAENATTLCRGRGMRDFSPEIATRFPYWPQIKSNLEEYDRWGEFRPSPIYITKESDEGCEVRLFSVGSGGDLAHAHDTALAQVFDKSKGVRANEQLKLATQYGADTTILLLDCDPGYQERYVENYLSSFPRELISYIDHIYAVGAGTVTEVFSSEMSR
jgi:hypothetical protein